MFSKYHYLSHSHNNAARCFLGFVDGELFGFCSALAFPHAKLKNHWRGHRTVVFPDFQGIGLGNRLSDTIGDILKSEGKRFISTSSNPAIINSRVKSDKWKVTKKGRSTKSRSKTKNIETSYNRITVSFKYIG